MTYELQTSSENEQIITGMVHVEDGFVVVSSDFYGIGYEFTKEYS